MSHESLTEAERVELRDFLHAQGMSGATPVCSGSDLDALQGFLTAIICTPEMILPSEWLPRVLGEPEYATAEQAGRILTLLMRLYNDVSHTLAEGQPLFALWARQSAADPVSTEVIHWCRGFLNGTRLREESWRAADKGDDELGSCLSPVLALAERGTNSGHPAVESGQTRNNELMALLPNAITMLYARMQRLSHPGAGQTAAPDKPTPLPEYDAAGLAARSVAELLALMVKDEDRVPRTVIDELARRGAETLPALRARLESDGFWVHGISSGEWWLRLHAVMLLGLLSGAEAGELLIATMRRMAQADDDALQDWLAGYWPALFANKPASMATPLRALCEDRSLDWYIRVNAVDAAIAASARTGAAEFESSLDWLAQRVGDEGEDWHMRLCSATTLLDFPRARHRPLLEGLAARQKKPNVHFSAEEVEEAYAAGRDLPEWRRRFKNPWQFYTPKAIAARQQRWAKEDAEQERRAADDVSYFEDEEVPTPYIRLEPKIGRNDSCPCGSGRKFKKCHGAPDAGFTLH